VRPGRPLRDRHDIFAALMDAQVPVEIVGEEEVIEDDALKRYRALYVADPHVDSRTQRKIKEWVRGGGVLWASHAALARQEYDETSPLFDEVFGLEERGKVIALEGAPDPDAGEEITVEQGDLLPAVTFKAAPIKPAWKVGGAKVLARFADGSPALVHNRFGKGQAFLFGNATDSCTGGYGYRAAEPPDAAKTREIVAVAARVAGVQPHVRMSHPRVLWCVHDGAQQAVLFLASCFERDLDGLVVEVYLPRAPASARSGRRDEVAFEWLGDRARLKLDLPEGDGEIVVFRY